MEWVSTLTTWGGSALIWTLFEYAMVKPTDLSVPLGAPRPPPLWDNWGARRVLVEMQIYNPRPWD